MRTPMLHKLRRFAGDETGNVTIETLIWLPLLLTVLASMFSLHDAFRQKSLNTKAAYTISDAISRETSAIDAAYLDGMLDLLEFLTSSEGPYSLRVTQVRYDANQGAYIRDWSQTRGLFSDLRTEDLVSLTDRLPTLLHNERVIMVETETQYVPPFELPALNEADLFYTYGFTRPRFAPQIIWSDS